MKKLIILIALAVTATASAATIDDAIRILAKGEPTKALNILDSIGVAQPKNANVDILAGQCYRALADDAKALERFKEAQRKGSHEAILEMADLAVSQYNIDEAESLIDSYQAYLKKNRRKNLADESDEVTRRLNRTRSMLDRVEDVMVIDSIVVDKKDFLKAYKLSPESGRLLTPSLNVGHADASMIYITEDGREKLWAEPDDNGRWHLMQADLLADGSWEDSSPVGDHLGNDANANYPFLMPDGITLYFASDSEESLGGYDIFISRSDGEEYLQPQNIGMPYNSPYDDYMFAIDETTGIGWWATDRNRIPGKVTIYMFAPSEMRSNLSADDPDLAHRAMLKSIAATQHDKQAAAALRSKIDKIEGAKVENKPDFHIMRPDGRVATRPSDFNKRRAADMSRRLIELEREISRLESELADLRKRYTAGDTSTAGAITSHETDLQQRHQQKVTLTNDIIRAEGF